MVKSSAVAQHVGRSRPALGEGKWVGAGEPMMYITGSFFHLVDLETIFLQKLGPACVAAYNAWTMCADMPKSAFLAMDARHCAGQEMAEMMAYAASVGSARAKRKVGAVGFIGNATHATAHFFGRDQGLGTMPHALIGYAGSTLRAAEMYHETFPGEAMTVLVDYFAREISDSLESAGASPSLPPGDAVAASGYDRWPLHRGPRPASSYAVLERFSPDIDPRYARGGVALHRRHRRVGSAIFHRRAELDRARFDRSIVAPRARPANAASCRGQAADDVVGSGSFCRRTGPRPTPPPTSSVRRREAVKIGREFCIAARRTVRAKALRERGPPARIQSGPEPAPNERRGNAQALYTPPAPARPRRISTLEEAAPSTNRRRWPSRRTSRRSPNTSRSTRVAACRRW